MAEVVNSRIAAKETPPGGSRKALIVGIDNYPPPNALPSCVADAREMAGVLRRNFGFQDQALLLNAEASKANLVAGLRRLLEDCGPDDRRVFFFSGHGYRPVRNGVIESALVTQDVQFFEDGELAELMHGLPAGVLTVITDSCFSGGMEKLFALSGGRVELGKLKHWIPPDPDEREAHRRAEAEATRFSPFGYLTPAPAAQLADNFFQSKSADFRIAPLRGNDSHAVLLSACLEDEIAAASTSQTHGLSAFTFALTSALGAASETPSYRLAVEAAGRRLREIGIRQTPMLRCPPQPAGLEDSAFLSAQDAAGASAAALAPPGDDRDAANQELARMIVWVLSKLKGEKQMQNGAFNKDWIDDASRIVDLVGKIGGAFQSKGATLNGAASPQGVSPEMAKLAVSIGLALQNKGGGADKGFLDDVGDIARIAIPIIASLQSQGGGANKGFLDDVGRIAGIVVPIIALLQSQSGGGANKGFLGDVGRIAGIVVPIIASLQSQGGGAKKGFLDDVPDIGFPRPLPIFPSLQSKNGGAINKDLFGDIGNIARVVIPLIASLQGDPANKGFLDTVGDIARIAIPIIASLQSQGGGAASKDLIDDIGRIANIVVPIIASLQSQGAAPQARAA